MRILLIEDDRGAYRDIVHGFKAAGHVCDALGDGEFGFLEAMQENYDLLVVDRNLPQLDTLLMVRAMHSVETRMAVLYLTSSHEDGRNAEDEYAGVNEYLVKPFAFSDLLDRAHALTRRDAATI